jgi:heme-degrading monooxygenase HmoA
MIRVLIERHIAESLEAAYETRSRKVLQNAVAAPGFISGEALNNRNDPNNRFILSNWCSVSHWDRWYRSKERKELMAELTPMMDREEVITILEQSVS